ncbi:RNA polymerase II transcription factor-like protein [Dendryphion nanum]|uniref:RNA polymerase II transcription factor-like protein n=1 Tax=Dendryphion nanum TaxID=256645 RepID=A0A9P9EF38_9PLEO|nr:RNA polymerase II transcription factor-like protein [Dendryphion nanum]
MSRVAAQYKKQNGTLVLSADSGGTVSWTSSSADNPHPSLTIAVPDITNLQQTPASAAKASIKIIAKESYTFTFNSATARDDQQASTDTLRKWIEAAKASQNTAPLAPEAATPSRNNAGEQAATTAPAQPGMANLNTAIPEEDTFDDAALLRDSKLQQSLLNSNPALMERFSQAVRQKPDNITVSTFMHQFWMDRVHLLRSHKVETTQGAGKYNVLAMLKPVEVNGEKKINMSKEQIHIVFAQHPLVRKAYNDNVPPKSEDEFWGKFFSSRLLKKLRGEKINPDVDNLVPFLDKYLDMDEAASASADLLIPLFLSVEGNEQNHSQKLGNRPDLTMRPNSYDKVPILRVLNRMSEKMMKDVPPSDVVDRHGPAGMDEETYKELQLKDLQRVADDNRVMLKVKDQSQLFAVSQGLQNSTSASTYSKRTPAEAMATVRQDLASMTPGTALNLESVIGITDDSSSDEESAPRKKARVGSGSSRNAATLQIIGAIKKRHRYKDDSSSFQDTASSEHAVKMGLSRSTFETLEITHNTTVEFLHYFWGVYFSGDSDRANEVAKLIETLEKSLDRIKIVADTADNERSARIEQLRKENELHAQRTGRKKKWDPNNVPGGAKVVNEISRPLVRAIQSAAGQYRRALQEQIGQAAQTVDR